MEDHSSVEKRIETYLQEHNEEQALELLFDLIVKYTQTGNFKKAEALREKLFEIDSMALNEIVKSAEIIDTAKLAAMNPTHKETWSHLYKDLTTEETIALYYGMKTADFEAGQIIFQQGEMNTNLYLINSGQAKLFYYKDKHAILINTMGPGDLVGEDTFFTNSTCTTSLMAHSTVKLNLIEKAVLKKWQAEAPNLANKLQDYCTGLEPIKDMLEQKELERRAHQRYDISGSATIRILDNPDRKLLKGDLADISTSGVSFIMNTSPQAAEALLGCQLNLKFTLLGSFPEISIDQVGRIVGVHAQMFNEYYINVRWEQPLEAHLMTRIKSVG